MRKKNAQRMERWRSERVTDSRLLRHERDVRLKLEQNTEQAFILPLAMTEGGRRGKLFLQTETRMFLLPANLPSTYLVEWRVTHDSAFSRHYTGGERATHDRTYVRPCSNGLEGDRPGANNCGRANDHQRRGPKVIKKKFCRAFGYHTDCINERDRECRTPLCLTPPL